MSSSRPHGRNVRILVVDDEPALREALVDVMRLEGYLVDEASNGAVALEVALSHPPHVVVFDYAMPITDGPRMVEEMRSLVRPMPVFIGISAATRARDWCVDNGVPIFLLKPFEDTTLLHAVSEAADRALELRGTRPQPSSGTRTIVRPACILAVAPSSEHERPLRDVVPASLRHARVVVVETPDDARRALLHIVPDLLVLEDDPSQDELRAEAIARGLQVLVRSSYDAANEG